MSHSGLQHAPPRPFQSPNLPMTVAAPSLGQTVGQSVEPNHYPPSPPGPPPSYLSTISQDYSISSTLDIQPPSIPPKIPGWDAERCEQSASPPFSPLAQEYRRKDNTFHSPPPRPPKEPLDSPAILTASTLQAYIEPHGQNHCSASLNFPPPLPGPPTSQCSSFVGSHNSKSYGEGNIRRPSETASYLVRYDTPQGHSAMPSAYPSPPIPHKYPEAHGLREHTSSVEAAAAFDSIPDEVTHVYPPLAGKVHNSNSPPLSPGLPQGPQDFQISLQSLSVERVISSSPSVIDTRCTSPWDSTTRTVSPCSPIESFNTAPEAPWAATSCIDFPATFLTTWYWHSDAPKFYICSKCYVEHLHNTVFATEFKFGTLNDGEARKCRLNQPRMKGNLIKTATEMTSLQPALDWMRFRSKILDCKGVDGVKGGKGYKWYMPRANSIPGFMVCQACYEDHILSNQFWSIFEPFSNNCYSKDELWTCALSIPFVRKQYEEKGMTNDWSGFVAEAKARLSFGRCPGNGTGSTNAVSWFVPKEVTHELMLCVACFADEVLTAGEQEHKKWREAGEIISQRSQARCSLGQFGIKTCMARFHETKDFSKFWEVMRKLDQVAPCDPKGINNGKWYTLNSHPKNFRMCMACYVCMAEPLNISHFFVPKTDVPAGETLLCCFNTSHPQNTGIFEKLIETYLTRDVSSLDSFASVWASILPCKRDEDFKNRSWYGWYDCTICGECYHTFAKFYPYMISRMELNDTIIANNTMCEIYSPRMQKLYKAVASSDPPELKPLLEYSAQRRKVYAQTVPHIRMIISQQKLDLNSQTVLNSMSGFHTNKGQIEQVSQAEIYRQQAMGMNNGSMSTTTQVEVLEKKWRAVE